eukprot:SAG31_NODE_17314_length_675_cov_2.725694_1_plen_225_part_11
MLQATVTGYKSLVAVTVSGTFGEEMLHLVIAVGALCMLQCEVVGKCPPSLRADVDGRFLKAFGHSIADTKSVPDAKVRDVFSLILDCRVCEIEDPKLAGGIEYSMLMLLYSHQSLTSVAESMGLINVTWKLHRRVCPAVLPTEWWSSTAAVVDVYTARMVAHFGWFALVARALADDDLMASSWFTPLMQDAISITKINHAARLSERDTMAHYPVSGSVGILSVAA